MATADSTTSKTLKVKTQNTRFNLELIHTLFSDPQRDRNNSIVVANHDDITANIRASDLIRVDFTETQILEGLYIITLDDGWIGYRFFQRMPNLFMRDGTESYPVTQAMLNSIKVVGKVIDIYRSQR